LTQYKHVTDGQTTFNGSVHIRHSITWQHYETIIR